MGKKLQVYGLAQRVTIYLTHDGKPSDKYYYQTHIHVSNANQIQLQQGS